MEQQREVYLALQSQIGETTSIYDNVGDFKRFAGHPSQYVIVDANGSPQFKPNELVKQLWLASPNLVQADSSADYIQLLQLLGSNVAKWRDMPGVNKQQVALASLEQELSYETIRRDDVVGRIFNDDSIGDCGDLRKSPVVHAGKLAKVSKYECHCELPFILERAKAASCNYRASRIDSEADISWSTREYLGECEYTFDSGPITLYGRDINIDVYRDVIMTTTIDEDGDELPLTLIDIDWSEFNLPHEEPEQVYFVGIGALFTAPHTSSPVCDLHDLQIVWQVAIKIAREISELRASCSSLAETLKKAKPTIEARSECFPGNISLARRRLTINTKTVTYSVPIQTLILLHKGVH